MIALSVRAQPDFHDEYGFLMHLEKNGLYEESIHYLTHLKGRFRLPGQLDTLNYLEGIYTYRLKRVTESISAFRKVSSENPQLHIPSCFYLGFEHSYLGHLATSDSLFSALSFSDPVLRELSTFERAGVRLLQRDLEGYGEFSSRFSGKYFQLSEQEKTLDGIADLISTKKRKSPMLAGLLSAVIPGAGKFYIGKAGQGSMTLITLGIFGLQSWEGYRKDGPQSVRFILFGSLFSLFYAANIWGSVVAVKIENLEFNNSVNEAILVNMHIPVRLLFK